ncbi:hypothetical protein OG331_22595 [Streptomyces sp. NBC_01017]|uniref:hypothetical protein n=1 Tax=Streptomyces sp. NBC_01017 TaxID=2903721 RepID=UPI0038684BC7|nr:hypothetical protein OG331_22595 [Streptomyces sp. NBC_01017]
MRSSRCLPWLLPRGLGAWRERAEVLISPAVSIVLGAKNLSDAEGLLAAGSSGVSQLRLRSTRRLDLGQTAV